MMKRGIVILLLMNCILQGCSKGGEPARETEYAETEQSAEPATKEEGSDTRRFTAGDGSFSVFLDEDWMEEEVSASYWLVAGEEDQAVCIMQFPKEYSDLMVDNMDTIKAWVSVKWDMTDLVPGEAPAELKLKNKDAYEYKTETDGESGEGYVIYGETDYAFYSFLYDCNRLKDDNLEVIMDCLATFDDTPLDNELDWNHISGTETIRWFNAVYALESERAGWDPNHYVGAPLNERIRLEDQRYLKEQWNVADKESADKTVAWFLEKGYRAEFQKSNEYLKEEGLGDVPADRRTEFMLDNWDVTETEAGYYLKDYEMYEEYGPEAVAAWDYEHAMSLLRHFYVAGYYSHQEMLEKMYEIASVIQGEFDSWDDYMDSCFLGYEYWSDESSRPLREVYEDLKQREISPYSVDFKTELIREWAE